MDLLVNVLRKALACLGILCVITVLFSLTARDQWWIRVFDYPRLQIALFSLAVLGLSAIFLDWKQGWTRIYLAVLLAAVLWQGYVLHPYFLPVQPEVPDHALTDPQRTFRLLSANVLIKNHDVPPFLALVEEHDPDLVLTIETDSWWTEQLAPLRQRYAYHIEQPQENNYGINLYSRFPLSATEIIYFQHNDTPSIYTVITLPSGEEVEFYGIHPRPPLPSDATTPADRELLKVAQRAQGAKRPVVVAGDFNDVPWSYTMEKFQAISQLRNFRVGRGFYNTFEARNPILRVPIDHIFTSAAIELVEISQPLRFSSDHLALFAVLTLAGDAEREVAPARRTQSPSLPEQKP
ncbi:MAG: endonuclease/exonuclease/phosphatase family protein [Caldilineaceae bacterium]|nr:endonuclease/exonuclease/phosphatase family protein [Caldilineaceae bacterium]